MKGNQIGNAVKSYRNGLALSEDIGIRTILTVSEK
jgi:hypothetical protein